VLVEHIEEGQEVLYYKTHAVNQFKYVLVLVEVRQQLVTPNSHTQVEQSTECLCYAEEDSGEPELRPGLCESAPMLVIISSSSLCHLLGVVDGLSDRVAYKSHQGHEDCKSTELAYGAEGALH